MAEFIEDEQLPQYYKVFHPYKKPIWITWNRHLLDEDQVKKWEAFKLTPGYIGATPAEISQNKRIAETLKLEAWAQDNQLGSSRFIKFAPKSVNEPFTTKTEWMFELSPGWNAITANQYVDLRKFEKWEAIREETTVVGTIKEVKTHEGFLEFIPIEHEEYLEIKGGKLPKNEQEIIEVFECPKCGRKGFKSKETLANHMKMHL